jgi:hypothetical protein
MRYPVQDKKLPFLIILLSMSASMLTLANTKNDPHVPLGHCYHWLNESTSKYLTYKYNFAKKHEGEITFYTDPATSNGSVAGPGLYCGKTPGDSFDYGDRVVRVDFVEDVVMLDSLAGIQYCGHNGNFYQSSQECQKKPWDVKFYTGGGKGQAAWYVIRNPQAIFTWSANSEQLVADLNAEKAFEGGPYAIKADATIKIMRAEGLLRGNAPIQNYNARLSIIKILQDQAKVDQVPPLTVIALVFNYNGPDLSRAEKKNIYTAQFDRAFKDTKLAFADLLTTMKLSPEIETSFLSVLRKINIAQLDKVNPVLVLQGLDKYETPANLSAQKVKALWQASLLSDNNLQSLVDISLTDQGAFATSLESSLPSIDDFKTKSSSYNLVPILKIFNKYVVDGKGASFKNTFRALLKELIQKSGSDFANTYDQLSNAALNKEAVLVSIVTTDLMQPAMIKLANPLTLGLALDRVEASVDPAALKIAQAKILKLPFLVDAIPSYKLLDDFETGKFKIPSFYPEQDFLIKMVDRSIEEQKVSKAPTNTFRLVMSGFYSFYNAQVKKVKDARGKDNVSLKAAQSLRELAALMNTEERLPYRYITLQNAGHFEAKGRAKDHPIEHELVNYKQGDAAFDKFIEETVVTSYDGSMMQYLIFHAKADPNMANLLKLSIDHLMSKQFSAVLASPSFIASQAEKKLWNNILFNKVYSPTGNTKVPSTVCHMESIFKKYYKELGESMTREDVSDMRTWERNMDKGFCKSP